MISIEIQEWQQMKAKVSQMQQEIMFLKNQNQKLRNQKNVTKKIEKKDSQSSVNISIGQNFLSDSISPQKNKVNNQKQDLKRHDCFLPPNQSQIKSQQCIQIPSFNSIDQKDENEYNENKDQENKITAAENDRNAITVSRKSHKSIQLKNIISSRKGAFKQVSSQLPLIQEICIFGPDLARLQDVTFKHDQKQIVQPFLYYPQKSKEFQQYGNYIYPKKVRIKPTQKLNVPMQVNKIIFKNSKKQDCNIFIFQGNQAHPFKKPNEVLQKVNPSKWLYGIVMEFSDFLFKQSDQQIVGQMSSQSYEEMQSPTMNKKRISMQVIDSLNYQQSNFKMETASLRDIEFEYQMEHMYRSTFSLCIFTYFPFVTYLQNVISSIFDQVKLKRIQQFPKTGKYKDCDVFYFINQLNYAVLRIKNYFLHNPVKIRRQLQLKVNQSCLKINLSEQNLYYQLYGNWAYKIIKLMGRKILYEIYCLIMLEESVYFVCQDKKILTFTILLFSSMLTQPFSYPYPVVSVVFSQELLQTPFTSIIGINNSQKWVQQAIQDNLIDLQNKHLIIIAQGQVKIRRNFKYYPPKSTNLQNIFDNFHKNSKSPSFPTNLLVRKGSMSFTENLDQDNDVLINFFVKLQLFFHDNIFSYMPNKMTIFKLGSQINIEDEQINKATVRNQLLDHIQKCYKQSNPNYYKDQFIKLFVKTQIFSICLMQQYQLQ